MKILSIKNCYPKDNQHNNIKNIQHNYYASGCSFNGYWNLDILKKTDEEVIDLAKYFYKSSPEELKDITTERTPILRIKRKYASLAAYYKMIYAIDKIGIEIQNIKARLSKLEQLYHIGMKEALEMRALNAKLEQYDDCFDKRYEKFYCKEEYLDEESLEQEITPFMMHWEDGNIGK